MAKKNIPEMLNVLTIITLGYSSLRVISGIFNFFFIGTTLEVIEGEMSKVKVETIENPLVAKLFTLGADNLEKLPIFNALSISIAILCIVSAFLMRNLNKKGYYLYILAIILEISIPIYIINSGIAAGIILSGSVFSILFIILYGVNLKHMK